MNQPLVVTIPAEQLQQLADMIAAKMGAAKATYTVNEAAEFIGCHPRQIRRQAEAGLLHPIPNLRPMRFARAELDRFIQQ